MRHPRQRVAAPCGPCPRRGVPAWRPGQAALGRAACPGSAAPVRRRLPARGRPDPHSMP